MAESYKPRVIAIGGPTASGKTALSIALARRFLGEVISADSMQIYRGLDVGTAKATRAEQAEAVHHLLDIRDPQETFSVAEYVKMADACIQDITARKKLPLVVGGTGLYISSLLEGISFTEQKSDMALRAALQSRAEKEGILPLYHELQQIDPEAAAKIHPNNQGRVIRALELYQLTGKTMTQQKADSRPPQAPYRSLVFCLGAGERSALYERIDRRVDAMLQSGILPEAEQVWKHREQYRTAAQAIGYKEFFPYFEGTAALEECAQKLKQASRNYAKRQLTWFRRMPGVHWLDMTLPGEEQKALELVQKFLEQP